VERQDRQATVEEQRTLAAWSAWGAVAGVFDEDRDEWAAVRQELRELVGEAGYAAARRTTINAHYTDPAIVAAIWQLVQDLGFDGGRVLEPGCGIGTFIGLAPAGVELTGVELDPATARLARALYPSTPPYAASRSPTRACPMGSLT
jgi:SAM-dependent methyltransferase